MALLSNSFTWFDIPRQYIRSAILLHVLVCGAKVSSGRIRVALLQDSVLEHFAFVPYQGRGSLFVF